MKALSIIGETVELPVSIQAEDTDSDGAGFAKMTGLAGDCHNYRVSYPTIGGDKQWVNHIIWHS